MWWIVVVSVLAGAGMLWWIRRALVVVTVSGLSMYPTYRHGDRVLVRRRPPSALRRGDVVVLEPPGIRGPGRLRWHIKRVVALPGDPVPAEVRPAAGIDHVPPGSLVVRGDNVDSVDSRQRGLYPADRLLGVARRRFAVARAAGRSD